MAHARTYEMNDITPHLKKTEFNFLLILIVTVFFLTVDTPDKNHNYVAGIKIEIITPEFC